MGCSRRLAGVLAVALLAVLIGGLAPPANAANYYWYQSTPTGGWWVGGGTDTVGAGFLWSQAPDGAWRTVSGGGTGTDPWRFSSGDYCNYYRLGGLNASDPNNVAQYTGFTPPDNQDYQIMYSGGGQSSCQANGNTWGWYVNSNDPGSDCPHTCGMQHSVSLGDSGTTLMPWASSFGDPSLLIKAAYHLGSYTYNCGSPWGCGAGWSYVGVLLQDTVTDQRLEFVLNRWSTYGPGDDPTPQTFSDATGSQYHGFANVQTNFDPYSDRATLYPGSATSQLGSGFTGQTGTFEAYVTPANLQNAINAVNAEIESKALSGQAQLPYSTDPTKYALVGIEDGNEMWGGQTSLGGYNNDLEVSTQY